MSLVLPFGTKDNDQHVLFLKLCRKEKQSEMMVNVMAMMGFADDFRDDSNFELARENFEIVK